MDATDQELLAVYDEVMWDEEGDEGELVLSTLDGEIQWMIEELDDMGADIEIDHELLDMDEEKLAGFCADLLHADLTNLATEVVRLRRRNGRIIRDCDVYIGRR